MHVVVQETIVDLTGLIAVHLLPRDGKIGRRTSTYSDLDDCTRVGSLLNEVWTYKYVELGRIEIVE